MNLLEFPPEVVHHIVSFLDVNATNELRLVCRPLNGLCEYVLVKEIGKLRRKSEKLMNDACDLEIMQGYQILLQIFSSLIFLMNDKRCCFNAGEVVESSRKFLEIVKAGKVLQDPNLPAIAKLLIKFLNISLKHATDYIERRSIHSHLMTLSIWQIRNDNRAACISLGHDLKTLRGYLELSP